MSITPAPISAKPPTVQWIVTAVIFIALIALPISSWLVRQEIESCVAQSPEMAMLGAGGTAASDAQAASVAQIAAENPSDYLIQLGAIVDSGSFNGLDQKLLALSAKFPDRPGPYAHIIRVLSSGRIRINRPDDYLLVGKTPDPSIPVPPSSSPADIAEYDNVCLQGERLDPTNAFFPLSYAAGLYAQNRDPEAIAEVEKAGSDSTFNDYAAEQVDGQMRIASDFQGNKSAFSRMAVQAALLFPQFATQREVARISAYQAILMEQQGRAADGLALRMALIKTGALMRVDSASIIGMLVGVAIEHIGMDRPGGIPYVADRRPEQALHRTRAFEDYLNKIGQPADATWVGNEAYASAQARDIVGQAMAGNVYAALVGAPSVLMAVGLILLSNIIWLILAGISGAIRSSRTDDGGLPPYALIAMTLIQVAVSINVGRLLLGFASVISVIDTQAINISIVLDGVILGVLLVGLPLGMTVKFSIDWWKHNPTPSFSIATLTANIAVALAVIYVGVVIADLHAEAAATSALAQSLHHEGAYWASQIGKPWPGPV